jgi:hypothetical protein
MNDHSSGADQRPAFSTLLYRFLFFDWLFRDISAATTVLEKRLAWQHNRRMRIHLPTYLRRWSVITAIDFALGCLFEHILQAGMVAAWFFTWSCISVTGMALIAVIWCVLGFADWY